MSQTAFIFPGQGAQEPGMGKDFYENSASAREVFDQAESLLGLNMKKLCFEENEKLNITEYTQIALLTACMAMERVVREQGVTPQVTAGLSLGEYCAIVSAGGMELSDAMRLVRKRGILMQEAVPAGEGSMAAVLGMDGPSIEKVLEGRDGVWIANYNCPGQIVITGYKAPVEEASKALQGAGAKRVLPLNVSGPFHSPMLEDAGKELGEVLENVELSPLEIPYVTNVTAGPAGLVAKTADGRLVTGDAPCRGISATGYLSLMDLLRRMGIMDEAGHILRDPYGCAMPLARRIAGLWDWNGSVPRLVLLPNLWMSSADVEEILKVKAAFAVAVESLLAKACLRPGSLNAICVAGALGRHVDAGILENLGFVPRGCGRMVRAVGNASLEGACLLAREPKYREELAALCARACVLAPAEEKDFHTRYVGAMNFAPWGEYAGKI